MFQKEVVVDARDHLMGRLASIVAKELLNGQKVVIVRAEKLNVSGSLFRNKIRYWQFLRKKMVTNPKKGQIHQRSPSKILHRVIRGMVPHKTARGMQALAKLRIYEGVPPEYQNRKRMVIPQALRSLRLKPSRKWCVLGDVSHDVGWSHKELLQKLEAKRVTKAQGWYRKTKQAKVLMQKSKTDAVAALSNEEQQTLAQFGY